MSDRHFIGKHWLRIEEDGTIFLKYVGPLVLYELERVLELAAKEAEKGPKVYMIFDVTEASSIEPAARKYGMDWLTRGQVAAAVNFGGSIVTRTAAEMLVSALRLIHKMEVPVGFVKTEQQARAWIAEQRQRLADPSKH